MQLPQRDGNPLQSGTTDAEQRAMGESHIPIRRAETPEEMAAVVAFPASSEAAYITGKTLY